MLCDTFLGPLPLGREAYQTPSTVISGTCSVYEKTQNEATFHRTILQNLHCVAKSWTTSRKFTFITQKYEKRIDQERSSGIYVAVRQ